MTKQTLKASECIKYFIILVLIQYTDVPLGPYSAPELFGVLEGAGVHVGRAQEDQHLLTELIKALKGLVARLHASLLPLLACQEDSKAWPIESLKPTLKAPPSSTQRRGFRCKGASSRRTCADFMPMAHIPIPMMPYE